MMIYPSYLAKVASCNVIFFKIPGNHDLHNFNDALLCILWIERYF